MNFRVAFNVPNMICYFRLVLILASLKFYFIELYILSASLDLVDGEIARRLGQCSLLGAALDMVADRVSNIVILCKIASKRTSGNLLLFLFVIDFISHFIHFSSSMITQKHHKKVSGLLSVYYNKKVLILLCTFSEVFFVTYYLEMKASPMFGIFYLVKSFFHVVQLLSAIDMMSELKVAS